MTETIYTIGHSTHELKRFIGLLRQHGTTAVADVRSHPYSRYNPQFNREGLSAELHRAGIQYAYLGRELGARPTDPSCYKNGSARYDLIAATVAFKEGVERVFQGSRKFRLALMCAEKDPLNCHRSILVARHLIVRGAKVCHILSDGAVETHDQALARLVESLKLPPEDMFRSREQVLEEAYQVQGDSIAYQERDADPLSTRAREAQ